MLLPVGNKIKIDMVARNILTNIIILIIYVTFSYDSLPPGYSARCQIRGKRRRQVRGWQQSCERTKDSKQNISSPIFPLLLVELACASSLSTLSLVGDPRLTPLIDGLALGDLAGTYFIGDLKELSGVAEFLRTVSWSPPLPSGQRVLGTKNRLLSRPYLIVMGV